jgi:3-methyladenine DNA glycosylase AlkD
MQLAAQFIAALEPLANTAKAAPMRAYMKDQFAFLGIPTPARRAATRPVLQAAKGVDRLELLAAAGALWQLEQREYHYAALDLLERCRKQLTLDDVDWLLALAQEKSWWDTIDGIAGLVGDVLHPARSAQPDCQQRMDQAAEHPNFWVRRIAMLHQLRWRGDTDTQRLFAYALKLAPESEFFIRKAIGWALREYAHHDPDAVRAFLQAQRCQLSALTVREAGKNLGRGAA